MKELLAKLFDVHKVPFRVVLVVFVVCLVVLCGPASLVKILHQDALIVKYGWAVGLTCLLSGGLVIVNGTIWSVGGIARRWSKRAWRKGLPQAVADLDHAEIAVLREFPIAGKRVINLPILDPTVVGLINKGIVRYESQQGTPLAFVGPVSACSVDKEATHFLTAERLEYPTGTVGPDDYRRITDARPEFAKAMADAVY